MEWEYTNNNFWTINSKKIEKNLKNFTKTIAKLKKLYYMKWRKVVQSGRKMKRGEDHC